MKIHHPLKCKIDQSSLEIMVISGKLSDLALEVVEEFFFFFSPLLFSASRVVVALIFI